MMKRIVLLFLALVLLSSTVYGITLLDATKPANSALLSTVPSYERETRVKVNEIIGAFAGLPDWIYKRVNYTAVNGDKLLVDTNATALTITLPASPTQGQYVYLADPKGTWYTNNVTVARNGSLIQTVAANYTLDIKEIAMFVYVNNTYGWGVWRISEGSGITGLEYLSLYSNFSTAITAIGSTPATLVIDNNTILDSNETIPRTLDLMFVGTGKITTNGYYLYLNSKPIGSGQIFDYTGGGAVHFGKGVR